MEITARAAERACQHAGVANLRITRALQFLYSAMPDTRELALRLVDSVEPQDRAEEYAFGAIRCAVDLDVRGTRDRAIGAAACSGLDAHRAELEAQLADQMEVLR